MTTVLLTSDNLAVGEFLEVAGQLVLAGLTPARLRVAASQAAPHSDEAETCKALLAAAEALCLVDIWEQVATEQAPREAEAWREMAWAIAYGAVYEDRLAALVAPAS